VEQRVAIKTDTTARSVDRPGRLEGWKEIADFFGRTVRTVQRWEREQALPIRRHMHDALASVYAYPRELEEWRLSRAPNPGVVGVRKAAKATHHEALECYVRARHYWNKRTPDDIRVAIRWFHEALDHDPAWAMAHSGLAEAYLALSGNEFIPPCDGFPKARAAAQQAIELDPTLPAARTALGFVAGFYEGDVPEAMREFDQAIARDPEWANAHYWAGMLALNIGDFQAAIQRIAQALDLAPLSPTITANMARPFLCMGRYSEAVQWCRRALDLDPNFWIAHLIIGWAYEAQRRIEEAVSSLQRAVDASNGVSGTVSTLIRCQALRGDHVGAKSALATLIAERPTSYVSAMRIARVFVALDDHDEAFRWLEKAVADRSIHCNSYFPYDSAFSPLKRSGRYDALMDRYFGGIAAR